MFGPFRRFDSGIHDHSASDARRALRSPHARASDAWAQSRDAPLVRDLGQRIVLVHELRQREEPKNSFTAAATGLALIISCGIRALTLRSSDAP